MSTTVVTKRSVAEERDGTLDRRDNMNVSLSSFGNVMSLGFKFVVFVQVFSLVVTGVKLLNDCCLLVW